jgi:transposase
MIQITPKHKIFLAVSPIDFRCGIPGISALCRRQWQQNPLSGHIFIFRNRRANAIKLLYYDGQGYWLSQKSLSQGRFDHWPQSNADMIILSPAQLHVLLYNGNPAIVKTSVFWRPIDTS